MPKQQRPGTKIAGPKAKKSKTNSDSVEDENKTKNNLLESGANDGSSATESDDDDDQAALSPDDKTGRVEEDGDSETEEISTDKQPAWIDEGDVFTCQEAVRIQGKKVDFGEAAGNDYKKSLEDKFQAVMGAPKWAQRRVEEDSKSDYLSTTGKLIAKSKALGKGTIEIQKLKDLNRDTYAEGNKITTLLFHPTSTVGLISGLSGVVSLVQADGKENTKLQTIQFRKFPVHTAVFLRNGEEFIVGSSYHHYFYTHDLISGKSSRVANLHISDITNTKRFRLSPDGKLIVLKGKSGNLHVLSALTKELISTLKMNGDVGAFDFIGSDLYSIGSEGEVYVWDMNARRCVHKFYDEGCIFGSALAASPDGNMLACGSNTGVINIYDVNSTKLSRSPNPLKTVLNMVTTINCLKFNPTSEILCMSSHEKDNAIKLLHCPSMTVFSNFPAHQAKLNRTQCMDFSPNSGYLGFGDNKKTAHLFRLKYYGNY